jgi:hypothetical protein
MFTYAFASCSIAWFPGIVLVGFLLAEGCPPTLALQASLRPFTIGNKLNSTI